VHFQRPNSFWIPIVSHLFCQQNKNVVMYYTCRELSAVGDSFIHTVEVAASLDQAGAALYLLISRCDGEHQR
jgi:hypothetical protein